MQDQDQPQGSAGRRNPLRALRAAALVAIAVALTSVGIAVAAGAPTATTTAATDVTDTAATLNGTVFPNQNATTYHFEYGTTTAYGAQTPTDGPVNGNAGKDVEAAVTGLMPSTTYHYRVVATNSAGTAFGSDATFTTGAPGSAPAPQNAVTITSSPSALRFGRATTIAGQVTGPGNAGVDVTLEENPHPYTGGFKATSVKGTTNAAGAYSLAVTPTENTRYRVTAKTRPPATSPETAVTVRVRVSLRLSDRTPAAGRRVRFSGLVTPGHDGTVARVQRRTRRGWRTVARTRLRTATPVNGVARSRYARRVRISRTGRYRVRVRPTDGNHAAGRSSRRRIRVH